MEKVVTIYGRLSHEHKKNRTNRLPSMNILCFFYKSTSKIRKPPMQSTFCISSQHMAAPLQKLQFHFFILDLQQYHIM